MKCECEEEGILNPIVRHMYDKVSELPFVTHKPNECKCTNGLKRYIRKGKEVSLCSNCCIGSDKQIQDKEVEK